MSQTVVELSAPTYELFDGQVCRNCLWVSKLVEKQLDRLIASYGDKPVVTLEQVRVRGV